MKESGRVRFLEKSFNFEMGGTEENKIECLHGWYRKSRRGGEECVKCGKPKEACEAERLVQVNPEFALTDEEVATWAVSGIYRTVPQVVDGELCWVVQNQVHRSPDPDRPETEYTTHERANRRTAYLNKKVAEDNANYQRLLGGSVRQG